MLLHLIRHGETDWNRLGLYQGTTDVPLNATGRAQAAVLARRLAGVRFEAAYTSPLSRARDTALTVVGERRIPVIELPELRELSYGLWQGRGSEPRGRCSAGLEWRWRHAPWTVRFPGGESLPDVEARAARALEWIRGAHDGDPVLVCGHGHLNRVLMIHALGWPRERFWEIRQPNAALCILELGARPRLLAGPDAPDEAPTATTAAEAAHQG